MVASLMFVIVKLFTMFHCSDSCGHIKLESVNKHVDRLRLTTFRRRIIKRYVEVMIFVELFLSKRYFRAQYSGII